MIDATAQTSPAPAGNGADDGAIRAAERGERLGSLRIRLTLLIVAIKSVVIWATCGIYWLYQGAALDDSLNIRRIGVAQSIATSLRPYAPHDIERGMEIVLADLSRFFIVDKFMIQVFDRSGVEIGSAASDPRLSVMVESCRGFDDVTPRIHEVTARLGEGEGASHMTARAALVPFTGADERGYVVSLTVGDGFAERQMAATRFLLLVTTVAVPIAAGISGWFIAGIAVAPLERLRQLASRLVSDSSDSALSDGSVGGATEVMRLAQELDAARARIAERFAAQERFLSNVSHELKTPISVMLTEAQTLDRRTLSPEATRFVESVTEEMSKLGRLVESFLSLSRLQDGKGLARFQPYAVNDLMMDSVENCRKLAHHYRVRIHPVLLDDDATVDASVAGEPELLRTMLDNIVLNAVRFSPEAGMVTVKSALAGADPRLVEISVEDEGPGIPPERIDSVFDRFSQAPNQTRHGRGHGLGLTIALGIAELHGGTIRVRNREPHGCIFTMSLPLRGQDHGRTDQPGIPETSSSHAMQSPGT